MQELDGAEIDERMAQWFNLNKCEHYAILRWHNKSVSRSFLPYFEKITVCGPARTTGVEILNLAKSCPQFFFKAPIHIGAF